MSDRASYSEMKLVFEDIVSGFFKAAEVSHGWSKEEFMANYREELLSDMDEETYDIVLQAPTTLQ